MCISNLLTDRTVIQYYISICVCSVTSVVFIFCRVGQCSDKSLGLDLGLEIKSLALVLAKKSWSWSWSWSWKKLEVLVLVLTPRVLVLVLVLKKSLGYITDNLSITSDPSLDPELHPMSDPTNPDLFFHCWSPWHSWTSSLPSELRKGPVHHLSCYLVGIHPICDQTIWAVWLLWRIKCFL